MGLYKKKVLMWEGLSPEDIESVSVLKDSYVEEKFGEKGKDGVVVIETKLKWSGESSGG